MTNEQKNLAVLAIGGNSLIRDSDHRKVSDQFEVTRETCQHIANMINAGWRVVITHGNGPQVGFMLRRCELSIHELHVVPLDSLGADTQGAIGYMIQQQLGNEFRRKGIDQPVATVVTQVIVDAEDPSMSRPSKPIGSFMDEATAQERAQEGGWEIKEDAGRGWRRVVPSPMPLEIVERRVIRRLADEGFVVVAVGGGGIPVVRDGDNGLRGIAAVIDKDHASALLATQLGADTLIISTAVDAVYLNFGEPDQRAVSTLTLAEAKQALADGHFPAGSMGPKMKAVIRFLEKGGARAVITHPPDLSAALEGRAGTTITP